MRDLAIHIHSFLEDFGIVLVLQWIPSHCDIPGNEQPDTFAKKGATQPQPKKSVS